MIRFLIFTLVLLATEPVQAASTVAGVWLTQDHQGVVGIAPCGAAMCARIVGVFLDRPDDLMPLDYRGVSQCELPLIDDAKQIQPNLWKGHINDPRNGSIYGVELRLDPKGNLALRGFLGIPLLGQTQIWTRYTSALPTDCRILPVSAMIGQGQALPKRTKREQ